MPNKQKEADNPVPILQLISARIPVPIPQGHINCNLHPMTLGLEIPENWRDTGTGIECSATRRRKKIDTKIITRLALGIGKLSRYSGSNWF